jgi:hypothetical protein
LRRLDAAGQTITMDADSPPDGQWLTLADLAKARGTSKASAARLVRRHKWRRQPGNDGHVRVLVPVEKADRPADRPADTSGAFVVIQAALAAQERAEARADRAESRADKLATELAEVRAWVESLTATLTQRDEELASLKGGFLVRLRRSWQIRRGS